jgi:translation initiation factor 4A
MASDSVDIESKWDEAIELFEDMNLREELLRGIFSYGFEKPSFMQQKGIRPIILGRDTIAQAQSGAGKTATFVISVLQLIDSSINRYQALILVPNRSLAQQIHRVASQLGVFMGISYHACIGGTVIREDIRSLERGVHVVVGTPGRVFDMMSRKHLQTDYFRLFILDEADVMLSRGFKDQIKEILAMLRGTVQRAMFSTPMTNKILRITQEFMRDPIRILVKNEELTLEGIKQYYIAIEREDWKIDTLCDLYKNLDFQQAIIYANTRRKVEQLTTSMTEKDFVVSAMHGKMEEGERELIMKEFRSGSTRVLITTNLLPRGIDVQQVSLVINFDMPTNYKNYSHRIHRTGCFGLKGVVISFVTEQDARVLKNLEQHYNAVMEKLPDDVSEILF